MNKKTILLLLIMAFASFLKAQKPEYAKTNYILGYHGNMVTNPGISGGLEWAFYENIKTKTKLKRKGRLIKYKTNRFELSPTIGFYVDPGSQTTFFSDLTTQYKRIDNKGRNYTIGVGVGYLTNVLKDVYTFTNGSINQSNYQSVGYLAPSVLIGIGKYNKKNDFASGWYSAVKTQFLVNYNATVLPLPSLQIGKRF